MALSASTPTAFCDPEFRVASRAADVAAANAFMSRDMDMLFETLAEVKGSLRDCALNIHARTVIGGAVGAACACVLEVVNRRKQCLGIMRHEAYHDQMSSKREQLLKACAVLLLRHARAANAQSRHFTSGTAKDVLTGTVKSWSGQTVPERSGAAVLGGDGEGACGIAAVGPCGGGVAHASDELTLPVGAYLSTDEFDALRFIDHEDAKVFWAVHAGRCVRRVTFGELVQAFRFEFPAVEGYAMDAADALGAAVEPTSAVAVVEAAVVSVYSYARFCGERSLLEAVLRVMDPDSFAAFDRVETILCEALAAAQRGGLLRVERTSQCLEGLSAALVKTLEVLHGVSASYVDRLSTLVQLAHVEGASVAQKVWNMVYVMQFLLATDFLRGRTVLPRALKQSLGGVVTKALTTGVKAYNAGSKPTSELCLFNACEQIITGAQVMHACTAECRREYCRGELHPLLGGVARALEIASVTRLPEGLKLPRPPRRAARAATLSARSDMDGDGGGDADSAGDHKSRTAAAAAAPAAATQGDGGSSGGELDCYSELSVDDRCWLYRRTLDFFVVLKLI